MRLASFAGVTPYAAQVWKSKFTAAQLVSFPREGKTGASLAQHSDRGSRNRHSRRTSSWRTLASNPLSVVASMRATTRTASASAELALAERIFRERRDNSKAHCTVLAAPSFKS